MVAQGISTDAETGIAVVGLAVAASLLWVCYQKGRLAWGLVGLLIPFLLIGAAIVIGPPDSMWALGHYGPDKMARARSRYPGRVGVGTTPRRVPQAEMITRIIPEGGLQGFLDPADDPVPAPGCWFRAGEAVTVLEHRGEWTRVRGRIGQAGWVKGQWLELQGYTVFRCPKCGHRTAASARGQCAYCDQPLTYADGIG